MLMTSQTEFRSGAGALHLAGNLFKSLAKKKEKKEIEGEYSSAWIRRTCMYQITQIN